MVALAFATAHAAALPPPERVRFESLARDGDRAVVIEALLFRPPGAQPSARPAVIALHGCAGLYRGGAESQRLTERHADRVASLVAAGHVVLLPDSLRSRGLVEVCTVKSGERTVRPIDRRLDALGALRWLAAQRGVDRERIALLGWSHGGSTALATLDASHPEVARFREAPEATFFRSAIAFYPGCTASARSARWRPAVPVRILIGDADDWTPAKPCIELAERARERGWPLETTVYPGAHHGFDAPSGRVRHRADVPNGVVPGAGVHVGPDPAARADANVRVEAFLRKTLDAK
jgi:dienelactone hydrolase